MGEYGLDRWQKKELQKMWNLVSRLKINQVRRQNKKSIWMTDTRNLISGYHLDGLLQERCNSIADALELHFSYINPSIWSTTSAVGYVSGRRWECEKEKCRIIFEGNNPQTYLQTDYPESKVHRAKMGPTWVLSAPDGPHVGPMNLAIRAVIQKPLSQETPHQG